MKLTRFLLAAACSFLGAAAGAQQLGAGGPSQRLLQEFASANDLRAFALQAKTRPGEGGLFYARYVADLCGRDHAAITRQGSAALSRETVATGTIPAWRLAMTQDLPRRCAGFMAGEAGALARDLKEGNTAGDPLLAAARTLRDAARSGRRELIRSAMARAMELDDPMLWTAQRLWDAVARSDPQAKKVLGLFVGGVVSSPEDRLEHLEASTALELGFCKPKLPCALDDELRMTCAAGGACAPDREAKARSFYLDNGGAEDGWRRVLALAAQVRTALANRDVAFFVR